MTLRILKSAISICHQVRISIPEDYPVDEDGEAEEHRDPERRDERPGPGEVEGDLLAKVLADHGERLVAGKARPRAL